jgi:tetratricopeptide (TPR) repeat protein
VACKHLVNKEFKEAIQAFDRLIKENPKNGNYYYLRGIAHCYADQHDKAISDFSMIIDHVKNPSAIVFELRGDSYYAIKNYKSAINDYNIAIKIDPKIGGVKQKMANSYSLLGLEYWKFYLESKNNENIRKAIFCYNKAIEIEPTSSRYDSRGSCYNEQGDYNLALRDFDNALNLNPNNATAFCGKAIVYETKGEPREAIYNYKKAIKLSPEEAYYYFFVGHLYLKLDDWNSAVYYLSKSIELGNKSAEAYHSRGLAYLFKKAYQQAYDDLSIAKKLGAPSDNALEEAIRQVENEKEQKNIQHKITELEYKRKVIDTLEQFVSGMRAEQRQYESSRHQQEQQVRYGSHLSTIPKTTHIRADGMGGYYADEGHYRSDGMGGWYTPGGNHQRSDGMGGWYKEE